MRTLLFFYILLPLSFIAQIVVKNPLRFLALGDSYTIGQSVGVNERWPSQLSDSLAKRGIITDTIGIIATTGWRTDDLLIAISGQHLENGNYNLVSLLIGVNNQYQGKFFSQYVAEFPALLDSAIRYAGGYKNRVFVVSIPDYAYTPIGQQISNPSQISSEIDQYNLYSKHVADSVGVTYINITAISRQGLSTPSYVANDGLHPSGAQYAEWVKLTLDKMQTEILTGFHSFSTAKNSEITLYPNPAGDFVWVNISGSTKLQHNTLEVYNESGSLIMKQILSEATSSIGVAHLPLGIYTFRIVSGSKLFVKKITIR